MTLIGWVVFMTRIFALLIGFWIFVFIFQAFCPDAKDFWRGITKRRQKKSLFVKESPNEISRYFDIISLVPLEFLCCVSDTIHIYSFETPECDNFRRKWGGFVRLITFSMLPSPTHHCKTPKLRLLHPTPPPTAFWLQQSGETSNFFLSQLILTLFSG